MVKRYGEVAYRVWLLEPGEEYHVRVEKFGSAIEPEEPDTNTGHEDEEDSEHAEPEPR